MRVERTKGKKSYEESAQMLAEESKVVFNPISTGVELTIAPSAEMPAQLWLLVLVHVYSCSSQLMMFVRDRVAALQFERWRWREEGSE